MLADDEIIDNAAQTVDPDELDTEPDMPDEPEGAPQDGEVPGYFALKFMFHTPKNGDASGGFCLIFEGETGKIIHQVLWLTRKTDLVNFRPNEPWESFIKLLQKLGPYDKAWGDKLNAILPDVVPVVERVDIYTEEKEENTERRKLMHLKGDIRRGFERATHCFFEVDCDTELLTRKELEKTGLLQPADAAKEEKETDNKEKSDEKSFKGTLISCTPVIDPVWGKASSTLTLGDLVEVQFDDAMGASGLVRKYLETSNLAPVFPVEEIDIRDGRTRIFLRINEEIIGVITLTKDLRLKIKKTSIERDREKTAIDDLVFFGVIAVALVGLLVAIRYLFM